jgi:hypothetical protein
MSILPGWTRKWVAGNTIDGESTTMTMKMALGIERLGWTLAFWNIVLYVAVCSTTHVTAGLDAPLIG